MGYLPSKRSRNRVQKSRPPVGKFQQYTLLVATIDHILNQIIGRGLLKDSSLFRFERGKGNQNKCLCEIGWQGRPTAEKTSTPRAGGGGAGPAGQAGHM
ncbi:hypothetical protein TIFTF001_027180 [Ficus carica]|uniref:Uncharacterized protein n=1 Tax=Ficus carica TaxID=3494 RepID=A0AA88DMV9_FICCA|nr:hypothetical protein TIFTF001_027180 [Ficus carica]